MTIDQKPIDLLVDDDHDDLEQPSLWFGRLGRELDRLGVRRG